MNTVTMALFLLLAVVVSSVLSRILPVAIPRPLVQIVLGVAVGLVAQLRVDLDPQLFFLLLLPPLLFLDGWRIPNDELFRDRSTILGLALGLVVFTVLGAGLLVHRMIPAMPLSVAFALAAVVSPTDPLAVSAIGARVPIPQRMMHVLEGESLLNDASGLVCLRFAVAATLTGVFSPRAAALTFLWVALGGTAIGAGLAAGVILVSLVAASSVLPLLLTGLVMPAGPAAEAEENRARVAAANAAMSALERTLRDRPTSGEDTQVYVAVVSQLIDFYRARLVRRSPDGEPAERVRHALAVERELRTAAIDAERQEIFRRIRTRAIGSEAGRRLVRELDLAEARYRA